MKRNIILKAIVAIVVLVLVSPGIAFADFEETIKMNTEHMVELWNVTFGGMHGDYAKSVQQTSDGGYILVGGTNSFGAGNWDIWLIKTDSNGVETWNRTFGGRYYDVGRSVQQTSDGGYILVGQEEYVDAKIWLIKTDSNGIKTWDKTFDKPGYSDWGNSVQQTSDGGYILVGYAKSFYGADAWLIKTDSNGNEEWDVKFGGTDYDWGNSVQQTSDGGYIVGGQTESFGAGAYDAWLIKTDPDGMEEWDVTFGGTGYDTGYSVQQTINGGYVLVGETNSFGAGNADVWLIKTDPDGNEEWNRTFGGTNNDKGHSVQQTSDSGYILVGETNSFGAGAYDIWLIKTDSNGIETWNMTFGGTNYDWGNSVQQTSDDRYIIGGQTQSFGAGNWDAWLIRLDSPIYTVVSIDPPTQNVEKGETFTVDVFVEPAEPIIAVTVDLLTFDPMLIQANSVTEGDLFAGLDTFFIPGTIDNVNGTISLISVVTIPATGVSDPGTFCTIEFIALDQFGTSILDLEGVEVSDELGNPVSVAVNDGSVTVGTNQPPYQPSDPDPYDGETDVDIDADLSWTGGDPDGDPVTYDVYFGTTSPPPQVEWNQTQTTYDPGIMQYGTKYYWKIVAWDDHDVSAEGLIWDFTTGKESIDWWSMFRHDLSHTGYSTSLAPDTNNTLWTYTADAKIRHAPIVVDGRVFFCFSGGSNGLCCLNEADGSFLWQFDTESYAQVTPAVSEGRVVFISSDRNLYCLNVTDGSLIWSNWTGCSNPFSDPMIANGKIFFGLSYPYMGMYCLNLSDGSEVWHYSTGGQGVESSPAIVDGKVFFGCEDNYLYCLDAENGSLIWKSYRTGHNIISSPAVINGRIFVGSLDHKIYCFNESDGSLIWKYTTGDMVYSSPAVAYGKVYIGSQDEKLYCLNAMNGSEIWNYPTEGYSSPAVADGKIFYSTCCLNATDGSLIWNYTNNGNSPSIADGKVFVGSSDTLLCFGPNQPPYQPCNPDPYDGETDIDINADLSWTGGDPDGDPVTYDVYFGTISPPPKVISNQSDDFYDPGTMDYNTMHYWQIVAWDNHDVSAEGLIWDFTTEDIVPEIEIEISGGFGVNAIIRNIGDTDITDLNWKIMANGGFILFGREKTGIIDFLLAGEEDKIRSVPFGFGRIQICVTAECEKTIDKFLLGFFILPR